MLGLGLDIARSGLSATGEQASIIARNIANAGNGLAGRKIANAVTLPGGGVGIASITRATNASLTRSLQSALSSSAGQTTISEALDRLDATVGDPELNASPAAVIAELRDRLQTLSESPDDPTLALSAVDAAKRVAASLTESTQLVQDVRRQADADLVQSVDRINKLLGEFEALNRQVVTGTREGADVTDDLDARDEVLRSLAEEIGIKTIERGDSDLMILTDSGLTLFDKSPRLAAMITSTVLAPGTSGNAVTIDGVPVTGAGALMAAQSGRIAGLAKVRDELTVTYQRQLDEIARGLIETFAEQDQSATPALPDIAGLFTYPGAPDVPPGGVVVDGLAGAIEVNASVDPEAGGDYLRLRDGAIGDPGNPDYTYNVSGAAGFSARLRELIELLDRPRAFDSSTGLSASQSVSDAATSSSGWLEEVRARASSDAEYRNTLMERTRDALSRATGVNLDEEMTALLEVERAYQTSSKLIATIDSLFQSLLEAV